MVKSPGKSQVGDTLVATVVDRNGKDVSDNVTFQWYLDDEKLDGETDDTLDVTVGMVGSTIKVVATAESGNTFESDETAPVEDELALVSVEGADGGQRKVLIAYFSEPIGDLQPGDIQIRKVSNNQLNTVEKVIMASDGMSATIQLIGYSSQEATGLDPNVDYKMIVTSDGQVAEKVFSIPGIEDEKVVTDVDSSKQTIKIGATTYTDANSIIDDYEEILGRTVTFTYDKNNVIETIDVLDETVIYTAVTAVDSNNDTFIDSVKTTEKETYQFVTANAAGGTAQSTELNDGSIYVTREIRLDADAAIAGGVVGLTDPAQTLKYAKIVLNGNGTIRSIVEIADWDKSVYVADVADSKYLVDAAGQYTNMTDFRILKNGGSATIDDIEAGDVVFISTDNSKKVAEIYSENTAEGTMKVYTGKIDIGSDRYKLEGQAVIGDKVVNATTANVKDYDGSEVVGYFDRADKLSQLVVTDESAATASEFVVLVENAKMYTLGPDVMLSFKAGDGLSVEDYVVNISDLKDIKVGGADHKYDATTNKFVNGKVTATNQGQFGIGTTATIYQVTVDQATDLLAGDLVKVVTNADGDVVGLELSNDSAADYDFYDTNDDDMDAGTNNQFVGKKKAMNVAPKELIEASTPVYVYDKTNKTVDLYSYSDVTFTATANATNQIQARMNATTKKVEAFYIDIATSTLATSLVDKTVRGIVDSVTYDKDGTNYAEIVVYEGTEKVTYKDFAQDCTKVTAGQDAKGQVLDIELTADGAVFSVTAVTEVPATLGQIVPETYHVDATYILNTETGVTTTILVKKADGSYTTMTWSELGTVNAETKTINVAMYGASGSYVDAIYVELDDGSAQTALSNTAAIATAQGAVLSTLTASKVGLTAATDVLPAASDGCTFTYALTTNGTMVTGFDPNTRTANLGTADGTLTNAVITLTITKGEGAAAGTPKTVQITYIDDNGTTPGTYKRTATAGS